MSERGRERERERERAARLLCRACCGDLVDIARTLEAAEGQASDVSHEKKLVEDAPLVNKEGCFK